VGSVGSIYVQVKTDTTEYTKSLAKLRSEATKSGREISEALNSAIIPATAKRALGDLTTGLKQVSQATKSYSQDYSVSAHAINRANLKLRQDLGLTRKEFVSLNQKMLEQQAFNTTAKNLKLVGRTAGLTATEMTALASKMGHTDAEAVKLSGEFGKLQSEAYGLNRAFDQSAAATKKLAYEFDKAHSEALQMAAGIEKSYDKMRHEALQANKAFNNMKFDKMRSEAHQMNAEFTKSAAKTKKMAYEFDKARHQADKMNKEFDQARIKAAKMFPNGIMPAFSSIKEHLLAIAIAAATTVYAIKQMSEAIWDAGQRTLVAENAYKSITGSTAAANKQFEFLSKTADELGSNFFTLREGYKGFLAAAQSSKLPMIEIQEIFKSVSNAGAILGLSNEKMSLTFLALEQMLSKGKVSMEEIRRQMGDSLPGAFQIGARSMGMTVEAFDKAVSAGRVYADDFLPKFRLALDKTFQGTIAESVKAVNKLTESWEAFKVKLSDGEFMKTIAKAMGEITTMLKDPAVQEGVQGLAQLMADLVLLSAKAAVVVGTVYSDAENQKTIREAYKKGLIELKEVISLFYSPEDRRKVAQYYRDMETLSASANEKIKNNSEALTDSTMKYMQLSVGEVTSAITMLSAKHDELAEKTKRFHDAGFIISIGDEKQLSDYTKELKKLNQRLEETVNVAAWAAQGFDRINQSLDNTILDGYSIQLGKVQTKLEAMAAEEAKVTEGFADKMIKLFNDTDAEKLKSLKRQLAFTEAAGNVDFRVRSEALKAIAALEGKIADASLKLISDSEKATKEKYDKELKLLQEANQAKYALTIAAANDVEKDTWMLTEKYAEDKKKAEELAIDNQIKYDADAWQKGLDDKAKADQKAIDDKEKAIQEAADKEQEAYQHMYDNIHDIAADFWGDMLDGQIDSWDDMLDHLKDSFKSVFAEILAKATTDIVIDIVGSVSGGISSAVSGSLAGSLGLGSDADSGGGGWGGLGSIGSSLWGAYSGSTSSAAMGVFTSDLGSSIGSAIVGESAWLGTMGASQFAADAAYSTASTLGIGATAAGGGATIPVAGTAGMAAKLAAAVPYVALAVGAFALLSSFMGDDPDPRVGLTFGKAEEDVATEGYWTTSDMGDPQDAQQVWVPGTTVQPGEETSANFDYYPYLSDVSTEWGAAVNDYFDNTFLALDEALDISVADVIANTEGSAMVNPDTWSSDTDEMMKQLNDGIFNVLRPNLLYALDLAYEDFDKEFFSDLATQIGGDYTSELDAFLYFGTVVEDTTDFMDKMTRQMEEFGETTLDAFNNIVTVATYMEEIGVGLDEIVDSAMTTNLNTLKDTWEELIEVLEDANISVEDLTEIESARNVALGASVTGLSTTALQSAIVGGGDINSILSGSVSNIMASAVAEAISEYYIMPLNEAVGAAIAAGDDLWSITAMVGAYDLSGAQDIVDLYTGLFETIDEVDTEKVKTLSSGILAYNKALDADYLAPGELLAKTLIDTGSNSVFDSYQYLVDKTAQVVAKYGDASWTLDSVFQAITDAGMTLEEHWNTYGYLEGISDPYSMAEDTGPDLSTWAASIDLINASIKSDDNDILDFANALMGVSAAYTNLNVLFQSGEIAADEYNSLLSETLNIYGDSVSAITDAKNTYKDFIDSIGDYLGGLTQDSEIINLSYERAKRTFQTTLRAAAGGDVDAQGNLIDTAGDFLSASSKYQSSQYEYQKDIGIVRRSLTAMEDSSEDQISEMDALIEQAIITNFNLDDLTSAVYDDTKTFLAIRDTLDKNSTTEGILMSDLFYQYSIGELDAVTFLGGLAEVSGLEMESQTSLFDQYLGSSSILAGILRNLDFSVPAVLPGGGSVVPDSGGTTIIPDVIDNIPIVDPNPFINTALDIDTTPVVPGSTSDLVNQILSYVDEIETARIGYLYNFEELDPLGSFGKDYKLRLSDIERIAPSLASTLGIPGYADGGISSGSTSGYPAMLHGTEAIIPLNSGAIPLVIKNDQTANEIRELKEDLRAANIEIIKTNKKIFKILDRVNQGGTTIRTTAVA